MSDLKGTSSDLGETKPSQVESKGEDQNDETKPSKDEFRAEERNDDASPSKPAQDEGESSSSPKKIDKDCIESSGGAQKNDELPTVHQGSKKKKKNKKQQITQEDGSNVPLTKHHSEPTSRVLTDAQPPLKRYTTEKKYGISSSSQFEDDMKFLQNLTPDQKRSHYSCNKYVVLSEVETWADAGKCSLVQSEKSPKESSEFTCDANLNKKISLFTGDITSLEIDCIVNAANSSLRGGGGVDGAIHRAAGHGLYKECVTLGGCNTGQAKISYGYKLPATWVIHTVGPMDRDTAMLTACYENSLKVALENGISSIAFPCIATGVYGFPNKKAAHIALSVTRKFLEEHGDKMERIIFCLFMKKDIELYHKIAHDIFPLE